MNETEICAFDDLFDFNWTDLVDNSEVAVATIDTFEPIGTSLSGFNKIH